MTFCDKETVRRAIEGKFVCLVGSGPGLLRNLPGFVDSHEVIVRVNNYALTGAVTGKRTDIHYSFYGRSIRKKVSELKRDGVNLCICKCPDAQFMESEWHRKHAKMAGVDFRYIYQQRKDWWFCPTYVPTVDEFLSHFNLLGGHVPTTGFAALLDILSYKPAGVYMSGFDFFQSRIHNVCERWNPANPDDPIGHLPDAERAWFAANVESLPVTMDEVMAAAIKGEVRPGKANSSRPYRRRRVAA